MLPFYQTELPEAGCDEAGRGCLAGPVFAAAVILPPDFYHEDLNDSKQMSLAARERLREVIEREALAWSVQAVSVDEIDKINILKASMLGMHRALLDLNHPPGLILVDGNRFIPFQKIPHQCMVKGDGKYAAIAAASVLAKTHRDAYMLALHTQFPQYDWQQNKGYPTEAHREAIRQHGPCIHHRRSFRLLPEGEQLRMW
ncbi:MAG: ribonuclease HII [Chitinophagales bacterium]|nr:ribonuclease HII [Chitinophagales bacterium]